MRGTASEVVQRPPVEKKKGKGLAMALIATGAVVAIAVVAVVAGGGGSAPAADPPGVSGVTPPPVPPPVSEEPKPEPAPVAEAPKPEPTPVAEAPKPEPTPVAEQPAPEPEPTPAPPPKIRVVLRTEPAGASVFLDGVSLGKTPYETERDAGEGTLTYALILPNHERAQVEIPADKGGTETVKLTPEVVKGPPPPAPVSTESKPTPSKPAPAPSKPKRTKPVKDGVVNPFK
jgi:hypothetical protein